MTQADFDATTVAVVSPTSLPATTKARRPRRHRGFDLQHAAAIIEGYDGAELLNQTRE